ncbi:MAG: hypothetical protein COV66_12965 [Nitrospinae bacterium CG11_big_fil_rev_8_21_14_0_20_45_15]|nr:MAG: hypothetical protein COV66_12965 [Nitrospinae bacterium CG11_big_fil_rev_8_21_14_0_20_45_15]
MNRVIKNKDFQITIGLLVLLLITRGHSNVIDLPDATLAVFFIGGIYLRRYIMAPVFLIAAAMMDNHAFANGVSEFCKTPAYFFLIPTYLTLWITGRQFLSLRVNTVESAKSMAGSLALSTSIAFILSSGGFSFFSGYYDHLTIAEHVTRSAPYYIPYVGNTLIYMSLILFIFNTNKSLIRSTGLRHS